MRSTIFLALLFTACATDTEPTLDDADAVACDGKCDDAFGRRTTAEICDAVDPRWGDTWEQPGGADKEVNATDAMACANRLFWSTRYRPVAVHNKFYLHKWICTTNPASHYAMNDEQREFYCSLSLHFRMCNTQGLYAIANIPDSPARKARENAIFDACLTLSGELPYFRTALQMEGTSDAVAHATVARLYDDYKVQPGLRIAPPSVNPDRAALLLFERLARISFYGITVPIELIESTFSNLFLTLDPREHESQIQLILFYRSSLQHWNGVDLLDVTNL